MIAEAAYFRALARGFQGGDPLDDWLMAEAEVDRRLLTQTRQPDEQAAYEQLRAEVWKRLAAVRESADAHAIQETIENGARQLLRAGRHAAETINAVAESLRKDLAGAATLVGPPWEELSDRSANVLAVWRQRGGALLARAAAAASGWLNEPGRRLEQPPHRAGEMVSAGRFECARCGERLHLPVAAHLPPCPRCRNLDFRRTD